MRVWSKKLEVYRQTENPIDFAFEFFYRPDDVHHPLYGERALLFLAIRTETVQEILKRLTKLLSGTSSSQAYQNYGTFFIACDSKPKHEFLDKTLVFLPLYVFCPDTHVSMPKVTRLFSSISSPHLAKSFCRSLRIRKLNNLPCILESDPLALFFGFCGGDVLQVEETPDFPGVYSSYLYVLSGKSGSTLSATMLEHGTASDSASTAAPIPSATCQPIQKMVVDRLMDFYLPETFSTSTSSSQHKNAKLGSQEEDEEEEEDQNSGDDELFPFEEQPNNENEDEEEDMDHEEGQEEEDEEEEDEDEEGEEDMPIHSGTQTSKEEEENNADEEEDEDDDDDDDDATYLEDNEEDVNDEDEEDEDEEEE